MQVKHCHVVQDPRTKESRGFAFVTMETVDDARRSIKYLHRTVLEGRLVTVERVRYLTELMHYVICFMLSFLLDRVSFIMLPV
jgi:RNA recognition motif-containing protein